MTTPIILLAALGILVVLGAALTVSWLGGMAAGRAVQWAMGARESTVLTEEDQHLLSPEHAAEMDAIVTRSQRWLRESQERAERMARM